MPVLLLVAAACGGEDRKFKIPDPVPQEVQLTAYFGPTPLRFEEGQAEGVPVPIFWSSGCAAPAVTLAGEPVTVREARVGKLRITLPPAGIAKVVATATDPITRDCGGTQAYPGVLKIDCTGQEAFRLDGQPASDPAPILTNPVALVDLTFLHVKSSGLDVVSVSPAPKDASVYASLSTTFSEAIDPASITERSIIFSGVAPAGANLHVYNFTTTHELSSDGRTLRYYPATPMPQGAIVHTTYLRQAVAAVRSTTGHVLCDRTGVVKAESFSREALGYSSEFRKDDTMDPPVATAGNDGITLTWDRVAAANSYEVIRRSSEEDPGASVSIATPAGASYVDGSANVGTTYLYRVAVRIGPARSAPSAESAAVTR